MGAVGGQGARIGFDRKVSDLGGRTVTAVDYWDVYNFGSEPSRWDYGQWHHAVMGVQLTTDRGPVTVTWTKTFFPYGVEVFPEPIEDHLVLGEFGPQRVGPEGANSWSRFLPGPIRGAHVWWDRLELGPTRAWHHVVGKRESVDLPTGLRVDFDAGSVWFIAGMPQWPRMEDVFIPGDEIMVVFSAEKMRSLGFGDPSFVPT